MNCENICVCSSWEYSLWLERSRDLRKPGGVREGHKGITTVLYLPQPSPSSSLYPALSSRRSGSMALEVTLLPQTFPNTIVIPTDLYPTAAHHQDHCVHLTPRAPRQ